MTHTQAKRALWLYNRYQCDTSAYRELAAEMGLNTGELNRECWHMIYGERNRQWQAAIDRDLVALNETVVTASTSLPPFRQ